MMSKLFSSFFFGLMLVLPLDFLVFIGLKKHYFDFYRIDVYFNAYFSDNQPFLYLAIGSFVLGFFALYTPVRKFVRFLYVLALLASCSALYEDVGNEIGKRLFLQKELSCHFGSQDFVADMLYEGRKFYFLKREGIDKTIKIAKDELYIKR